MLSMIAKDIQVNDDNDKPFFEIFKADLFWKEVAGEFFFRTLFLFEISRLGFELRPHV